MDRRERIGDEEETLRMAFDSQLANLWTSLPAIVTAVDLTKMTVSAQPSLKGSTLQPSGEYTSNNLPILVDVPIQFPSAGGFALTLPIKTGDEILIVFASRCIDAWWQSGGIQEQLEFRMHDLSDGFAIVGISSVPNVIPNISAINAQLRSKDGTTFLEITPDGKINLTAPTSIAITSPSVTMSGTLAVTGAITSGASVTAPLVTGSTNVIMGGISGTGHVHSDVQSGTSNTGAPQ
jgi:hypothetical protein